ncbi:AMP-binding enzyme [Microterricola viridarii]|uniref:long-chain-fatty-acid--CoA ligase n=1 Tax=Microterricola viridarii TaxID=412690 RepID=A0A0Y0MQQ2_9MICO|nr:AMP-binding protein [Microterricola viridarii]AMB58073.1 hypothetical protein AWU67_03455 [Microterricola viridarii]
MTTTPWLGGADADTALTLSGSPLSYGALREQVAGHVLAPGDIVRADYVDDTAVLVTVLAALAQGRPVLVSDPLNPAPLPGAVQPSTGLLLMTSGSSGRSRAVARTAASWFDSFAPFTAATGLRSTDIVALTGPLHVSMHLFAALHTLWLGAELRGAVSDSTLGAAAGADAGPTAAHCTPAVLRRLLSAEALPARLIVAGAALQGAGRAAAEARGSRVTEYYGAAELSFVAVSGRAGRLRPFPGVEIEQRDAGVAWVRSPYLSLGYAATAHGRVAGGALRRDDRGFASVGDLVELAPDGTVAVRGRADTAVTTAGSTVLSEDIERALEGIAGLGSVAVLAEPHPVLGEIVVAVLERTPALEQGQTAVVRTAAAALLNPVERPRRWLLVDALPRTASGKLAKGVLRAGLDSGAIPFADLLASDHGAATDV